MERKLIDYFPQYEDKQDILKELLEYQRDLDLLADKKVSIQFTNKGKDHAILVMSKIFRVANSKVKLFVRNFSGDISDNELYLFEMSEFLNRSNKSTIDVIFEKDPNPSSKALKRLLEFRSKCPERITLLKAKENRIEEFQTYLAGNEKMINFMIADDETGHFSKYRCETVPEKYIAILNFDDPQFCSSLDFLFNILKKDAVAI